MGILPSRVCLLPDPPHLEISESTSLQDSIPYPAGLEFTSAWELFPLTPKLPTPTQLSVRVVECNVHFTPSSEVVGFPFVAT